MAQSVSGPQEFKINSAPQLKLRSGGEREKRAFSAENILHLQAITPTFLQAYCQALLV